MDMNYHKLQAWRSSQKLLELVQVLEPTRASEQREIHRPVKFVTLIITLRALNLIDYHLLRPLQQLIADLVPGHESLVKSRREDHHSTNSFQELIYQVITNQNLSNLVPQILSREHRGVKGLNHLNNNVKHLNEDILRNNKHQHQCSS